MLTRTQVTHPHVADGAVNFEQKAPRSTAWTSLGLGSTGETCPPEHRQDGSAFGCLLQRKTSYLRPTPRLSLARLLCHRASRQTTWCHANRLGYSNTVTLIASLNLT